MMENRKYEKINLGGCYKTMDITWSSVAPLDKAIMLTIYRRRKISIRKAGLEEKI